MDGNIESLPPYAGYPQGRVVYGSGAVVGSDRRPDPALIGLLTGQGGYQPPVVIDTSWLVVGHADETMRVVRADNARGWTLAVADPRRAVTLLRDAQRAGAGKARLFAGTRAPRQPTVDEVLGDRAWLAANERAARHIGTPVAADPGGGRDRLLGGAAVLGDQQQWWPRHASRPSLTATPAIARAAIGSAHHQPNRLLTARPTSSTAERYVHSRVCLESATADRDPSSRPARRCAAESAGITTSDSPARNRPTEECSGRCAWTKALTDS